MRWMCLAEQALFPGSERGLQKVGMGYDCSQSSGGTWGTGGEQTGSDLSLHSLQCKLMVQADVGLQQCVMLGRGPHHDCVCLTGQILAVLLTLT